MTGGADGLRVALVHDWLTGMRGGEKALEVLCELYPQAELFTLVHVPGRVSPVIERRRIHRSFVQHLPFSRRFYRHYLPLFPLAIERFDFGAFDLIVSTSHCVAKAAAGSARTRHLCYCFTPMRYAWDQFDAYFGPRRVGPLASRLLRPVLGALARWDAATAGRPDRYVAISQHVARRIDRYYNRRAPVVYPPVDTEFYTPDGRPAGGYFLIVSALVPYKRLEVAIEACQQLGAALRIVGEGPERARLERLAGPSVEFLGHVSNEEIRELYRGAMATLLPGEEDFGIVPVESQACGRPVVALDRGGARETVVEGLTGVLVSEPTGEAFAAGLERVTRMRFDASAIRESALRFSRGRFAREIQDCIAALVAAPADARTW